MALYVLVGPNGKVYGDTCSRTQTSCWECCPGNKKPWDGHFKTWTEQVAEARRLGWRVRKCKIVLEEE